MRVCSFFASRLLYSALRSRRGQAAPTGQGLAARTEAWRLPAGGALLKTPNLIGLMAHSSARSTAWKSRIYLSRSQFHLCLTLQPQLPQFSRTGEKLLLRCVIFCSCLWSVSFSFLAGFEKPLGALLLCIVLFKPHQTPESQQSSPARDAPFLSGSSRRKSRNPTAALLGMAQCKNKFLDRCARDASRQWCFTLCNQ